MPRIAVVKKPLCNPEVCGNYLCTRVCPVNRAKKDCIVRSEDNKVEIDEKLCIGCNICVQKCPFEAIHIINLPEELKKAPIHRYGPNQFALYNLPIPVFGKVVGIVGINGIGKTTAINILAGVLKPNLGSYEKEANVNEVIDYFKGTEAQLFFQKIRDGEIKVSYKPQHVDLIPKKFNGNVIDLLRKADEKKQADEIIRLLELEKIREHNIKNISGGELQRVAVAATVLKKANLYIFDEVTSYLDIKQRLKVAKFIRELADEKTAVIVIEHDLIALDYMTDLVNIMYGKAGCFGIVSNLKPTKNGINAFLEGYLKEENVRFRDHKIKFEVKPPQTYKREHTLTNWPELTKKLNGFTLESKQGELYINEKVGVLGENGIGKTTFVKLLAGVIEPDKNKLDLKVKVAYKPQYIDSNSGDMVMVVLQNAIKKYEVELIRPLNIKPLLKMKISELSGGELQRVAVCSCLSQEADLFLLDEPSAYLDVEQRLIVSKVVANVVEKRKVCALVVDHDLLFLDYLSDRLLVFSGEPAIHGIAEGPFNMEKGMNALLKELEITLRRDQESKRPRINKLSSVKDREQKGKGKYYYA
ncbi:ribosome biogenesis/translation initiation ATPase RLI [Candidatus Woesearchaeota archaeon]|nr:ribosome biogenesis/translation initiation ATPase RLI [Candidatus Woesearchaeota archaeon]